MTADPDPEDWHAAALAAAAAIDLTIPPECLSGVAENLRLIAEHAARVAAAR